MNEIFLKSKDYFHKNMISDDLMKDLKIITDFTYIFFDENKNNLPALLLENYEISKDSDKKYILELTYYLIDDNEDDLQVNESFSYNHSLHLLFYFKNNLNIKPGLLKETNYNLIDENKTQVEINDLLNFVHNLFSSNNKYFIKYELLIE